jgi:hypothetical protein
VSKAHKYRLKKRMMIGVGATVVVDSHVDDDDEENKF